MPEFDMFGYRRLERVDMGKRICNDPGEPPKQVMLRPSQLIVNEEYQRSLSKASIAQIRNMAHEFDWDSYKALNVAPTESPDIFEVIDGQHTAIAALTNGRVPYLPCLLHASTTLKDKAKGFIGINTKRIALTPMAIFHAQVAAQDDDAIAVELAMGRSGVTLLPMPPSMGGWKPGDTMAIGTMLSLVKRGGDARLSTVLRVAVLARAAPISSILIKALDLCIPLESDAQQREAIVNVLKGQGVARFEVVSKATTPPGKRSFEVMADTLSDLAKLPRRRMGRAEPKRRSNVNRL